MSPADAANRAIALQCDFDITLGFARVGDRHEMLAAVLDPFDRAAELFRHEGEEKIIGVEFAARSEAH
jgi:hypothetical protein